MNDDTTSQEKTPSDRYTGFTYTWDDTTKLHALTGDYAIEWQEKQKQSETDKNLFMNNICACPTCPTISASVTAKFHFKDMEVPEDYRGDRSIGNKWHFYSDDCKSCKNASEGHWIPRMAYYEFLSKHYGLWGDDKPVIRDLFEKVFVPMFEKDLSDRLTETHEQPKQTWAGSKHQDESVEELERNLGLKFRNKVKPEESDEQSVSTELGFQVNWEEVWTILPHRS